MIRIGESVMEFNPWMGGGRMQKMGKCRAVVVSLGPDLSCSICSIAAASHNPDNDASFYGSHYSAAPHFLLQPRA